VTILLICWILPDSDSFVDLSFRMKAMVKIVESSYYVFMRLLIVTRQTERYEKWFHYLFNYRILAPDIATKLNFKLLTSGSTSF
jgi:hypothetical protein